MLNAFKCPDCGKWLTEGKRHDCPVNRRSNHVPAGKRRALAIARGEPSDGGREMVRELVTASGKVLGEAWRDTDNFQRLAAIHAKAKEWLEGKG